MARSRRKRSLWPGRVSPKKRPPTKVPAVQATRPLRLPKATDFYHLGRTALRAWLFFLLTGIPRSFLDQRRVLAQNANQAAERGPGTVRPAILTHRAGVSAVVASMAASGGAESPFRARRSPGGAAKLATETLLEAGGAMFWRRPTSWRGWTRVVRRCDNELSVCAFMLSRSGPSRRRVSC